MQSNKPVQSQPQPNLNEPELAKVQTNSFKANYMQNVRKQRKKRAIAEG